MGSPISVDEYCQKLMPGVIDPLEADIQSMVCSYPAIEGANKGSHTDAGNIPTTQIGLTQKANDVARDLNLDEWKGRLKTSPGKAYSARELNIPWTASQQFEIASEYLRRSVKRYSQRGVRLDTIPRSLRVLALDLNYNAGNHALHAKGDESKPETRFVKNLRTYSSTPSSRRTPVMAFDAMKETLDIVSDNRVFIAGLVKRRANRFNEVAKEIGIPPISSFKFSRDGTNGVIYNFAGSSPARTTSLRVGRVRAKYDTYSGAGFGTKVETR